MPTVAALEKQHPRYKENLPFWEHIALLYQGGYALRLKAGLFLSKRPMEPAPVYAARLQEFTYENVLETACGWYRSFFFQDDPQIYLAENDVTLAGDPFFEKLMNNADRAGTPLLGLVEEWFKAVLCDGSVYVLIDTPGGKLAESFRDQKENGDLDPYLVTFSASQITNWACDPYGNYEWILIATTREEHQLGEDPRAVNRWYYFDRETYTIWESDEGGAGESPDAGSRAAAVIAQGRHALAAQKRVPVRKIEVPKELWLAYRVYPQILDHLNMENAFKWSLTMACFPVLTIEGGIDVAPTVAEHAWLDLPAGSKAYWLEVSGTAFEHAAARVRTLVEEIFRQMYLQAQGKSSSATAAAQSGWSKQIEMTPSHEAANGFGSLFRAELAGILSDAALVRGRVVRADVQGWQFAEKDVLGDLAEAEAVRDAGVQSDAFDKYVQHQIVRCFAPKADRDTIEQWDKEIDAAPAKSALEEAAQKQQMQGFRNSLESSLGRLAVKDAA